MDRFERLINLVAALYSANRPLTRDQIFDRLPGAYEGDPDSARRAFERDKDALRSMGVPVEVGDVASGWGDETGYQIRPDDYELPPIDLEADELAALHVAMATVRMEGANNPEAALWKLGGAAGAPQESDQVALPVNDDLAVLFDAVLQRRTVTFKYRSETRLVEPRGVAFRSGHWYLSAHDRAREAPRNFRLDRFDGSPVAGPPGEFERPAGPAPRPSRPWEMADGEPVTALLLVDGDLAGWAEQDLGSDCVSERRDDGSVVFALGVTNPSAFRSFVLGFLDRAEVLSPAELRDDVVSWLEAIAP